MSNSPPPSRPLRNPGPRYRPVAMLGLLYFAAFFLAYCMLLVMPELMEVLETVPTGPEQEAAARDLAKEAIRPHLLLAFALALATTALGAHYKKLPGFRF
jgi:hypothetical protein